MGTRITPPQGAQRVSPQLRVPMQRPTVKTAPPKPKRGLIERMAGGVARALGLNQPVRPQTRPTVDRFQRNGDYRNIAPANLASVTNGKIVRQGQPSHDQLLHFLNGVIVAEAKSATLNTNPTSQKIS